MAIKGKKKSGNRGSQARRRPAAAPRPVPAAARRKDPWYNTAAGRVIAAMLVVLLIAGIGTLIAINRSNANEDKKNVEAIEDYTSELSAVVQSVAPAVGAMSAVSAAPAPDQLETLKEDAKGWVTSIEAASSRVLAAQPPEPVGKLSQFFAESFQLYLTSARLIQDAADVEGQAQTELLTRSTEVRAQADAVWQSAVNQLDEELAELGGDPSGLQSPGIAGATAAIPTAPPSDTSSDGGSGEGGGGGAGEGAGDEEGGDKGGGKNGNGDN